MYVWLLSALLLFPQDPGKAHPKVDQGKVDQAVEQGARFLLSEVEGGLDSISHPVGGTNGLEELVLYTLLHAGADPTSAAFQKLVEKVTTKKLERTYNVSVRAMALESLDKQKYQQHLAQCAQFLVDNQCSNGQWGYGSAVEVPPVKDVATGGGDGAKPKSGGAKSLPRITIRRRGKGPANGDNSNSQYAALGIRACLMASIDLPKETLTDALKWWEGAQNGDGGWAYDDHGQKGGGSYGSMTAGGVGACLIYRSLLRMEFKRDAKVLSGFKWMDDHFLVDANPEHTNIPQGPYPQMWHYYWLYAVERTGMLYGTESFGKHEWYPEGANWLLSNQKGNGAWVTQGMQSLGGSVADTCFAILFLRRATKPLPGVKTR